MKKRGRGKRASVVKERDSEDWCFLCKEGGELRICDYQDCLKSYHDHCVKKDESFIDSKDHWSCGWHFCCECNRAASFHCYCCPNAVCLKCIPKAKFVVVRQNSGFCPLCLYLLSMIEEDREVNSDGETVDFEDLTTREGLFKDYYLAEIKKKNCFTPDDVRAAKDRAKKDEFDADYVLSGEEDESASDYEVNGDDIADVGPKRKKRFKGQPPAKKAKNVKSKEKMQFTGWGSSRLISFLESIGEDTTTELSELQVENRIKAYAKKEKLTDPKKKSSKMILCDAKLHSLFEVKAISKNKIGSLIKPHFATFVASEEEEEDGEDEDEEKGGKKMTSLENKDAYLASKPRRKTKEENDSLKAKSVCHTSESSFAAIVAENIKLVYLRKSLLQELYKDPGAFQEKVTGSFIRAKTDPNDYTQKYSHELLQVTGVKRSTSGDSNGEMILLVSKRPAEIRLNSLSDGDFEEEECVELMQKVKDGLIPKPTVAELQKKASSLHVDITKHWIARELKFLEHRIAFANEKGRRQQLFEYLDRRKLLQNPAEQSRLLETFPNVKADVLETASEEEEQNAIGDAVKPEPVPTKMKWTWGINETSVSGASGYPSKVSTPMLSSTASENQWKKKIDKEDQASKEEKTDAGSTTEHTPPKAQELEEHKKVMKTPPKAQGPEKVMKTVVDEVTVIELSSDDESAAEPQVEDPKRKVWLVAGPSGKLEPGKYSLTLLRKFIQECEFALKYKAWKETESYEQAIPLADAVNLAFVDAD